MDAMLAEIQRNCSKSLEIFGKECPNLSNLLESDQFDLAFFRLRTELKQSEHELAWILRQCFTRATTLSSKLKLLEVFHGPYQRDVIQRALIDEEQWIITNIKQEFQSIVQLVHRNDQQYSHWPPIARQLLFLFGLKQRIDLLIERFTELCPKIINSAIGWEMKEAYRMAKDKILKFDLQQNSSIFCFSSSRNEEDLYTQLEQSATSQISDLLLQPVFVCLFSFLVN